MALSKQMEMFDDGGLKDEGGMIDEVSGNDVPSGSTREEVRDDIPAQLSEGEFVFPADVVRYIGLEKLMTIRQEAKQGLKQMEAMGQMGNSDEATMRDDLPFDINDLDIEDELEYNRGGVIRAQQGTYVAPTIPMGSQPLGTNPMGNPTQMLPQQVASGVSGASRGTPYTPNVGKAYGAGATPYAPVSYTDFLGTSAGGAPTTETVRYFNEATGQTRMIPHLVNADGSRGATLYPIPEGFVIQEEAPKEEAKKTQVQSAKVKPVESGDGSPSDDDGKGGASLSFGGTKSGAGIGLQSGAITANISYNINPMGPTGLLGGLMTIGDINKGKDVATIGNKFGLTTNPVTSSFGKGKSISLTSAQYAQVKNNPTGPVAVSLKDRQVTLDALGKGNITYNIEKGTYADAKGKEIDVDTISQAGKDIADHISQQVSLGGKTTQDVINGLTSSEIDALMEHNSDVEDEKSFSGTGTPTSINLGYEDDKEDDKQDYSDVNTSNNNTSNDSPSDDNNDPGGFGDMSGMDFNTGGLAGKKKKKPKPKKMKRGGLASR